MVNQSRLRSRAIGMREHTYGIFVICGSRYHVLEISLPCLEDISFRFRKCLLRFFSLFHTHVSLGATSRSSKKTRISVRKEQRCPFLFPEISPFRDRHEHGLKKDFFFFFYFREIKRSILCLPRSIFNRTTCVYIAIYIRRTRTTSA